MQQQMAKKPFRYGTRRRLQKIGQQTFTASGQLSFELPRVGLLNRIYLFVEGTNTIGTSSVLSDRGPWNLVNRLKLNLNVGNVTVVDVSGYGAYLVGGLLERGSLANKAGIGDTTPHVDVYRAPVASGANLWNIPYCVQVAANTGPDFELGLLNLQAPEVRCTLDVTLGSNADPLVNSGTTGSGFVGTVYAYYDYYEVPDPRTVQLPPFVLFRTLEETMSITAVGDNIYTVPRMGVVGQLIHVVRANGARSDGIDSLGIKFNKTDQIYAYDRRVKRYEERINHSVEWPVGVYHWDLWHAMEQVSQGDFRDTIDSEAISTLESIITVSSGTTLGSSNNFIDSIRRIVQTVSR